MIDNNFINTYSLNAHGHTAEELPFKIPNKLNIIFMIGSNNMFLGCSYCT